jgi:hypothetical protein
MNTKPRIRRSPEQWRAIFTQFESSGLSAPVFCQQQNIAYGTFQRWRQQMESEPGASRPAAADWLPIHLTDAEVQQQASTAAAPAAGWDIELALPGGVVLRMKAA